MDYLSSAIAWIFWTLLAALLWVLKTALWMFFWLILPLLVVAFVALRLAEQALGKDAVRAWVKARTLKYGSGAWIRARRLTFALGALPVRVLAWFVLYAVWHAIVSLAWRPKWGPWQRAWSKRWKPVQRTPSGRAVKAKAKPAPTVVSKEKRS